MKFDEAFQNFMHEITKEYGPNCEITKIAVNQRLMERIVFDFHEKSYGRMSYMDLIEPKIFGVPLYKREKEKF